MRERGVAPTHQQLQSQLLALQTQFELIVNAARDEEQVEVPNQALHTKHVPGVRAVPRGREPPPAGGVDPRRALHPGSKSNS